MNNKLAQLILTSSIMLTPYVSAVELYDDGTNNVTIGGFIDARVIHTQGQTEII